MRKSANAKHPTTCPAAGNDDHAGGRVFLTEYDMATKPHLVSIQLKENAGTVTAWAKNNPVPLCTFQTHLHIDALTSDAECYSLVNKAADMIGCTPHWHEHDREWLYFHTDPIPHLAEE